MIRDVTRLALALRRLRPARGGRGAHSQVDERGVAIGTTPRGQVARLPAPTLEQAAHAVILAASGAGKTLLTASALAHELAEPEGQGEACLVVDPKGDLAAALLTGLAAHDPARLAETYLLDPFGPGFAFNLNHLSSGNTPLDIRATQLASLVAEVSTATGAQRHLGMGARQLDCLTNVLLGALSSDRPGASVLWALDALTLPKGLTLLAGVTTSERARQFLLSAKLSDELRASTASRLRAALAATSSLEGLVSAPSCVQFADLLAPGTVTIVDLGRPTGGLEGLQAFYANAIVRLALDHLMERPSPWHGHHVRIVVDEAQVVAPVLADVAERVLTTGRSRGLSLIALSQGTTLLSSASPTLLRVLMTNSSIKLIGRLSAPDAELLAREQSPRPGTEEPIGLIRSRFAAAVTNLPDREFFRLSPGGRTRFTSQDVDLAAWAVAHARHAGAIEAARGRLALPRSDERRVTLGDVSQAPPGPRRGTRRQPDRGPEGRAAGEPRRRRERWGE